MQMTPEVLEEGCYWAWQAYYSIPSIVRRILKPGEKVLEMAANMYFNWAYRRMVKRLPTGSLTPLAEIFDHLQAEIDGSGHTPGEPERAAAAILQIQVGRDYLHCKDALLLRLEGVLNERTAASLKDRIITAVKTTDNDLIVHCGGLTSATPNALQMLLDATQRVFEQHRTRFILQDLSEALRTWLAHMSIPSYVSVIEESAEATAAGN
jgi:anti-anti-sigma regulatory factor